MMLKSQPALIEIMQESVAVIRFYNNIININKPTCVNTLLYEQLSVALLSGAELNKTATIDVKLPSGTMVIILKISNLTLKKTTTT